MEAADAKGELASMLDRKVIEDPYIDYLKLTENDIVDVSKEENKT